MYKTYNLQGTFKSLVYNIIMYQSQHTVLKYDTGILNLKISIIYKSIIISISIILTVLFTYFIYVFTIYQNLIIKSAFLK